MPENLLHTNTNRELPCCSGWPPAKHSTVHFFVTLSTYQFHTSPKSSRSPVGFITAYGALSCHASLFLPPQDLEAGKTISESVHDR